jgi:5-methylcytosine-specific restriction endonuclease McrA
MADDTRKTHGLTSERYGLFEKLSRYDPKTGTSDIIDTDSFTGEYESLKFGNGSSWSRMDGPAVKRWRYVTVKQNGEITYSWARTAEDEKNVKEDMDAYLKARKLEYTGGRKIRWMKIYEKGEERSTSHAIHKDIRAKLAKLPCVACGSFSNIEIDHKNGLYNEPRVLNIHKQEVSDFQPLCKHCNDQKRQTMIDTKKTGKRYSALNIPSLRPLGIAFTIGNETYDPHDIKAMIGTYWYDPVDFIDGARKQLIEKK